VAGSLQRVVGSWCYNYLDDTYQLNNGVKISATLAYELEMILKQSHFKEEPTGWGIEEIKNTMKINSIMRRFKRRVGI